MINFPNWNPQGHEHQTTRKSFNAKAKKCGLIKDKKAPISFKTRAEALHMCVEHSEHTQYPCMVQGCLSVVKLESSMSRKGERLLPGLPLAGGWQPVLGAGLGPPTCLEALVPSRDSRAMTRSPSPRAWRPDFPGAAREAP